MLKKIRKKNCLTQEGLAQKTGISRSAIARMELGIAKLNADNLVKAANALGCTVDDLLKEGKG